MEYKECELLLIQIVLGVIKMIRVEQKRAESFVINLEFIKDSGGTFWIRGQEIVREVKETIGGELFCHKKSDSFWHSGETWGYVYLHFAGKCPFQAQPDKNGMRVLVKKGVGDAMTYKYQRIGEFRI